jgi:hypothetical protein
VRTAERCFALLSKDRQALLHQKGATIPAVRLLDLLPNHPMITLPRAIGLLETTKPTAAKAIDALCRSRILKEITGKSRDRVYAYQRYLALLTKDTESP